MTTEMHTQTWTVRIDLSEDDTRTHAHAVLTSRDGLQVVTDGEARRRPGDADVPEIGEELAVSRALYGLADRLMDDAEDDVARFSHPG